MPTDEISLHRLATTWAQCIARAERPSPFSSRDGSVLRLVPANERLTAGQLQQCLVKLLSQQQHLLTDFEALTNHTRSRKVARHVAAWARGWCYLSVGNNYQALRDANTALAYAADASNEPATRRLVNGAPAITAAETTCSPATVAETESSSGDGSSTERTGSQDADNGNSTTSCIVTSKPAARQQSITQSSYPITTCAWSPALQLAAECHAALDDISGAVVLLAQADQQTPNNETVKSRLSALSRQLPPEQGLAWRSGGLSGLLQQLQDQAEMKLPEVLRPRPKWYYYNKWMTNRIHTALLDLHLGGSLSSSTGQLEAPSSEQLRMAAEAAADTPAVTAAAAAAGFLTAVSPVATSAARGGGALVQADQQPGQMPMLQLPGPVVDKLLSLDAGDLDLMIKHPTALQAQVYELLDVYEMNGAAALQNHTIPELTWEEVQVLAAGGAEHAHNAEPLIGLPLGYTPQKKQPALPAGVAAVLPAVAPSADNASVIDLISGPVGPPELNKAGLPADSDPCAGNAGRGGAVACGADAGGDKLAVVCADSARDIIRCDGMVGWRMRGWKRAEYLLGQGKQS